MLTVGDKAPSFELPNADMQMINSADLEGKNYVLYFYPKDDTPGCTIEAQEFSDLDTDFEQVESVVYGVSKDTCTSHGAFRDKFGLTVCLLADVDGQLCNAYGVWQEKEKNGEKKMGIVRSTFIVGKDGLIKYAEYNVKPKGHAEHVLEQLKELE